MHHTLLVFLVIGTVSPERSNPNPRDALKLAELKVEKCVALESVELTSGEKDADWTYKMSFNRAPDCPHTFKFAGSTLCLIDHVEKAQPLPNFSVKADAGKKCVTMTISAKNTPKAPLVRKIERVKGEKLVTYEATFEKAPTEAQVRLACDYFIHLTPRDLILESKDPDKPWKFRIHTTFTEGEKTVLYAYEAYDDRDD